MQARSNVSQVSHSVGRGVVFGLVSIIASGCAAGISNQPHGRAAGQWSVTLPAAPSYSQGLAYGRGGSSQGALRDVDEALFADANNAKVASDEAHKRPVQRKRRADKAAPAPSEPAAPTPVKHEPASPPARMNEQRTELALADVSVTSRYETREAQSQAQQQFRGGDYLVIGASTLLIVILIVLLVLLLL
ncbi:MAG TPA: hypothetical protein VFN67_04025 [Polyangiales bacterium]|nr:hypothetical protein [Polyangiales bacterium]